MEDETKKIKDRPLGDMLFRLACVYVAATFFFNGFQDWRDEEYLKAGMDFSLVVGELGLIFKWYSHESNIIKAIPIIAMALSFIFLILRKLL